MAFGKGTICILIDARLYLFGPFRAGRPFDAQIGRACLRDRSRAFANMLQRYVEGNTAPLRPTHVAVIFDKGKATRFATIL